MKYLSEKEERFDSIYRSYEDDVFRVCLYITKDYDLAQDLAQQTFVNFYNRFENVEPEKIRAYLISTAKHLYYNYQRDAQRGIQTESISNHANSEKLITESLEEEYFRKKRGEMEEELIDKILNCLQKRHENWYEIFDKMYYSNNTYEELSNELGITKEVLYSRIYRARRYVQKHYGQQLDEISDMV